MDALDEGARRLAGVSAYPRRDSELLLMHILECTLATLLAHPKRSLEATEAEEFDALLLRRSKSEPIQYILGQVEFFGLPLKVTPAVLIPRPETELVVESVLARIDHMRPVEVADVGTGSGAIAIALAHELPHAVLAASDVSRDALAVARENAARNGVLDRIRFVQTDLLDGFGAESIDAIVSNPPYVASGEELEPQVERFEPHLALYGGRTGLDIVERLIPECRRVLKPGGWLFLEIGAGQRATAARLLGGWSEVQFADDLQGIPRVAIARREVDNGKKDGTREGYG